MVRHVFSNDAGHSTGFIGWMNRTSFLQLINSLPGVAWRYGHGTKEPWFAIKHVNLLGALWKPLERQDLRTPSASLRFLCSQMSSLYSVKAVGTSP